MDGNEAHREPSRSIGSAEAVAAAWLLSVGFDVFLHAGLLVAATVLLQILGLAPAVKTVGAG